MKCIVCHSEDLAEKEVLEHLPRGNDIVCIPIRVLVCNACGERYYNRCAVRKLEEARESAANLRGHFSVIGQVLLQDSPETSYSATEE